MPDSVQDEVRSNCSKPSIGYIHNRCSCLRTELHGAASLVTDGQCRVCQVRSIVPAAQQSGTHQIIQQRQQRCNDRCHVGECRCVECSVYADTLIGVDDAGFQNQPFGSCGCIKFNRQRHQLKEQHGRKKDRSKTHNTGDEPSKLVELAMDDAMDVTAPEAFVRAAKADVERAEKSYAEFLKRAQRSKDWMPESNYESVSV